MSNDCSFYCVTVYLFLMCKVLVDIFTKHSGGKFSKNKAHIATYDQNTAIYFT